MKKGYPTNQNLETNQLEPPETQEIHPLKDSYINHDILSSQALSSQISLSAQVWLYNFVV